MLLIRGMAWHVINGIDRLMHGFDRLIHDMSWLMNAINQPTNTIKNDLWHNCYCLYVARILLLVSCGATRIVGQLRHNT